MKSIEEIIKTPPVVSGDFASIDRVWACFDVAEKDRTYKILFATYGYGSYDGDAWVLAEKDGQLFEVRGGHCSCYGLEGQFDPEPVVLKELENRLTKGSFLKDDYYGYDGADTKLKTFLGL